MAGSKIYITPSNTQSNNNNNNIQTIGNDVFEEESNTPRERNIAKSQITWSLKFTDPDDEKAYGRSLKNLFYFPTFWPIILIFIAFSTTQNGVVNKLKDLDPFLILSFIINVANIILMIIFTFAQSVDYFKTRSSTWMIRASHYFLTKFCYSRTEDLIILLSATGQGIYALSLISRDLCASCGGLFTIDKCLDEQEKSFPISQAFFGYVSILILPIYFKSINRHVIILSLLILTAFYIAAFIYGEYDFEFAVALFIIFFLVSIYEFERYKMTSFLLGKEALTVEQNKLIAAQEKSKIIERKLHMALVHQILPPKVAEQIIAGKTVEPELFEEVTIFFSDVVGFTNICAQVSPIEVVRMLNDLYTVMDYCTSLFTLYKVETIGDAYMLVGGLPVKDKDHAKNIADFALLVRKAVQSVKSPVDGSPINIRIGIHSGSVMAGVVGNLMPRYCLFGDTVNTASRMESNGQAGMIHCSGDTARILLNAGNHNVIERGAIEIKGKGTMVTYWLDSAKENNIKSNSVAVEKIELKVEEVLEAAHAEAEARQRGYMPMSPGRGPNAADMPRGTSLDSNVISPTPRGLSSPTQSELSISISKDMGTKRFRQRLMSDPGVTNQNDGLAKNLKVLVVEDSPIQRKVLVQRLNKADETWDVSLAINGEDALQKLKAARLQFDVIFVDENLSISDGLYGHELVTVMRESFHMHSTVIIACTGNVAKNAKELMASGVDIVWPKPPPAAEVIKAKILQIMATKVSSVVNEEKNMNNTSNYSI